MEKKKQMTPSGAALIPFGVFIAVYLGAAVVFQLQGVEMAFYQMPAPIAVLAGIIVAFCMFRGSLESRMSEFVGGCGDSNIMTMCCIYLLAGGFAAVARAMGGVESTANLGLSIVPPQYITAGLFVIAMFVSLSTGTSVGTIGAIGPIAIEVSQTASLPMAAVLGAVIGGAMFGDNLSMISDTTIAATKTQGVEMRDKFRLNFWIAFPPALLTFVLLLIFGRSGQPATLGELPFTLVKVVPYLLVLMLALLGVNVFVTLVGGMAAAIVIGLAGGDFTLMGSLQSVYAGFEGMFEIFLLAMLTGGLSGMVAANGGIAWLLEKIQLWVKGRRSAEVGIAALVSLVDLATANNTVAIVIAGPVAKNISTRYRVDPRRSASLLDTWSCVWQGVIPYGAQMLVACSLTAGAVNPFQVMKYLWYPYFLAVFVILSMLFPYADGIIRRTPWNWGQQDEAGPPHTE